ncbi:MAG: hypothetical protein H7201_16730 [Candidatus Saccharibacteria bacterium]|nr:hypothetical protein [Microbacteriaceae bacterium]
MRTPVATLPLLAALLLALAPLAASPALASAPASAKTATAESSPITWSVKPSADSKGPRSSFEYATDPGTEVNDTVIVINSGTVAGDFSIYAADAINDRETGDLSLLPQSTKSSDLGSWVTLDLPKLHLEPGTQATIPFKMLIPSDASPGDHSAGIVASSMTTGTSKGQSVIIDQRVGARINLRVSGALAPKVAATGFVTGFSPSLNPFAPGNISVDYSVVNRGNIRLDITQQVDVVGPLGIHLGRLSPPSIENLLPGQAAHVTSQVSGVGALLLAWSKITVTPAPVGAGAPPQNDPKAAANPNAEVDTVAKGTIEFEPVSATSLSIAITWTLMAIFVILALLVLLVARYIRTTRAQFYEAVDRATAEARENSAHDVERSETVPTR